MNKLSFMVIVVCSTYFYLINGIPSTKKNSEDSLYDEYPEDYYDTSGETIVSELSKDTNILQANTTETVNLELSTKNMFTVKNTTSDNINPTNTSTFHETSTSSLEVPTTYLIGEPIIYSAGSVFSFQPHRTRYNQNIQSLKGKVGSINIPENCSEFEVGNLI